MACWCAIVSFTGAATHRPDLARSGERAAHAVFAFSALAFIGLAQALLRRDFSYSYVVGHITVNMPAPYVLAAIWSGPQGSALLWALLLAACAAVAATDIRRVLPSLAPHAVTTLGCVLAFVLAAIALDANPFDRMEVVPGDGRGMNPQLQNPGMLAHPPLLVFGLAATAIPFALGISAMTNRVIPAGWVRLSRRWMFGAWLLLSAGVLSGMWWAYVEPGWGGYWSWDPVQSSALLPWLVSTAGIHALVAFERRSSYSRWLLTLVTLPFILAVFTAFVTRGVLVDSIHSFARSPMGTWFSGFLVVVCAATTFLLATRPVRSEQPATATRGSPREAALLYGTVVLVGIAFSVSVGLLFPLFNEWMGETRVTVAAPFFNHVNAPFVLVLLALMGVAQLLDWPASASTAITRQMRWPAIAGGAIILLLFAAGMRDVQVTATCGLAGFVVAAIIRDEERRYGRYITHAAVAMLLAAFTGMRFVRTYDVGLTAGQAFDATDPFGRQWRFTSQGLSRSQYRNSEVLSVTLELRRDGEVLGLVTSEKRQYVDSHGHPIFDPSTEAGIRTGPRMDTYVVLAHVNEDVADVRITFNPLVAWVWIGGVLLIVGGVVSLRAGTRTVR